MGNPASLPLQEQGVIKTDFLALNPGWLERIINFEALRDLVGFIAMDERTEYPARKMAVCQKSEALLSVYKERACASRRLSESHYFHAAYER